LTARVTVRGEITRSQADDFERETKPGGNLLKRFEETATFSVRFSASIQRILVFDRIVLSETS
jgi:hypothetical protein